MIGRLTEQASGRLKGVVRFFHPFPMLGKIFRRRKTAGPQYRSVIPNHLLAPDDVQSKKTNPNRRYAGNKIKTTKYSLLNFLPKNLFEQFHRFANLYFVFLVFLNWFPQIETFGKEISMIPVLFVLSVTAIKDIYEDRRRYRSDQKINHTHCRVYSKQDDRYVRKIWKEILVGDIVHLSCNEIIPADLLLLRSSDTSGSCFVETSNLDGESNLKQRHGISSLQTKPDFHPLDFKSTIECEVPNNQIYKFSGFILHSDGTREGVNRDNLLLRGCEIRNTDYVEGIVVYAGHETKAMMNNSGPRYKRSRLEKLMNWDIIWCVFILLILCFVGAVANGIWLSSFSASLYSVPYLPYAVHDDRNVTPESESFLVFWSYVIILQVMIPISLYVSIEVVKLGQVFFITQDKQLYHAGTQKRIQCRALNMPEELGQVQYVMCDKTGTLTENHMIFRRCAIAGCDYGSTDINALKEQNDYESIKSSKETCKDVQPNRHLQKQIVKISQALLERREQPLSLKKRLTMDFFVNMAICNTVVVNAHPHKDSMSAMGGVAATGSAASRDIVLPAATTLAPPTPQPVIRVESIGGTMNNVSGNSNQQRVVDQTGVRQDAGLADDDRSKSEVVPPTEIAVVSEQHEQKVKFIVPPLILNENSGGKCSVIVSDEHPIDPMKPNLEKSSDFLRPFSGQSAKLLRRVSISVPVLPEVSNFMAEQNPESQFNNAESPRRLQAATAEDLPSPKHLDLKDAGFPTAKSESNLAERHPNGTVGLHTARSALWLKPVTLKMEKLWHDIPPFVARLKLPPLPHLMRKSPNAELNSPGVVKNPIYEAESPDELALVYAASAYGVRLVQRRSGRRVVVETPDGSLKKYRLMHTLPFDSTRKRMSVVVQEPESNKLILYCKGADSTIMELLSDADRTGADTEPYFNKALEITNYYASHGLRTLCLAKKELNPDEYSYWLAQHNEAELALEDRDRLLYESACRLECQMSLLGVTGIEDRLQDGVPHCIDALRRAGLRVWVLTGDKIETAVNIAYACRLFVYGMELVQLSARTEDDAETLLQHHVDNLTLERASEGDEDGMHPTANLDRDDDRPSTSSSNCNDDGLGHHFGGIGLVVDGRTLALCLTPRCEDKFVRLVARCTSVLCCRATPLQKAAVVRLVKHKIGGMTLAIGDGANDVSMIQCADVGVGISGQEGMQAVMASDFAMARFRFLQRLLFVHGHWCYDRIARIIAYFFYKNALFVFTLSWFQLWNGFSAQVMIEPLYLILYNLVFTSLPPLLMGVFDQNVPDHVLLDNPRLYSLGSNGQLYTWCTFWLNILDAFWQSIVVFYVSFIVYYESSVPLWTFGFQITSCLIFVNLLQLGLQVEMWSVPMATSMCLSLGMFYAFSFAYNAVSAKCCSKDAPFMVSQNSVVQPLYWLCLLFISVICVIPRLVFRIIKTTFHPSPVLLAKMKWKKAKRSERSAASVPNKQWIAHFNRDTKTVSLKRVEGEPKSPADSNLPNQDVLVVSA